MHPRLPHAPSGADVVHVVKRRTKHQETGALAPDFMDLDEWPISVCVAWIAWRDPVRVSPAYSEWRKWRGLPPARSLADLRWNCEIGLFNVSSRPEPIPEAAQLKRELGDAWEKQLRAALSEGEIRATGIRLKDRRPASIKPEKWIALDSLEGSETFGTDVDEEDKDDGFCPVPRYRRVRIKKHDVLAQWPGRNEAEVRTGFPGRPRSNARVLMEDEMGHRFKTAERCGTLAEEVRALLEWLEKNHPNVTRPTFRTAEQTLRDLWRDLNSGTPKK